MTHHVKNIRTFTQTLEKYVKNKNYRRLLIVNNCSNLNTQRFYGTKKMANDQIKIFEGEIDRYKGITIDTTTGEPIDIELFPKQLQKSLDHWTVNAMRTVWFKIKTSYSQIVPMLAENGFDFHHASPGFVMMAKWLPIDSLANIPEYAHTMIGVGGLVINEKNQILTISEKHAIIPGSWKLPGGYVEPNENFVDAVIREVAEETGIETTFDSLVCFRHALGGPNNMSFGFGCSDLYVVIALKAESNAIQKCDREIAHCEWMDLAKYMEHQKVHKMNRLFVQTYIDNQKSGFRITCQDHVHELLKRKYQIYSAQSK